MKKIIIIMLVLLFMLFPNKMYALDYSSKLSGNDKIFAKSDMIGSNYTNMYVDISNFENISSLDMYVKYDRSLIGISTCHVFNYIGAGCTQVDNNIIKYSYRYVSGYESYFNKYSFYTVTFLSTESTPDNGTTTVEVYFENAKDKDQNSIEINPSSKTYTFSKSFISISDISNTDSNTETQNSQTNLNDNTNNSSISNEPNTQNNSNTTNTSDTSKVNSEKSNNNYLKFLKISNYEIQFEKDKYNYEINVDEKINKIQLDLELDDNKSTYNIIGADDLNGNNNKVSIEVTAENGDKRVYTIDVKINEDEKIVSNKNNKDDSKDGTNLNKKYITIGIIVFCIIITIILIVIISDYINKKQLDKYLDKIQ